MAQELPIYGILTNVTTENIIARSKQIEFVLEDGTKTDVEDALKNRTQFLTGEEIHQVGLEKPAYDCMMICKKAYITETAESVYDTGHIYYYSTESESILDLTPETGGGEGGSSIKLTVTFNGDTASLTENLVIPFYWSSVNTGYGYVYCRIDGFQDAKIRMTPGENKWVVSKLKRGTHTLSIEVTDSAGITSSRWTKKVVAGALEIESTFEDGKIVSVGSDVVIPYTYYTINDDPLDLLVSVDGTEEYIEEISDSTTIYNLKEGSHIIELRLRSNSGTEENPEYSYSNVLRYNVIAAVPDVLYLTDLNNTSFDKPLEIERGNKLELPIRVTKLNSKTFTASLKSYILNSTGSFVEDPNSYVSPTTWKLGINRFIITSLEENTYKFVITVTDENDGITNTIDVYSIVKPSSLLTIDDVKNGLMLRLKPENKTNNDINRDIWEDSSGNGISVKLHNFNYTAKSYEDNTDSNGNGWARDKDGINRLIINSGAYVEIDYAPLLKEIGVTDSDGNIDSNYYQGLTVDIQFKTKDILYSDAKVLSCFNGKEGFWIDTEYATLSHNNKDTEVTVEEKEMNEEIIVGIDKDGNPIKEPFSYIKYIRRTPFWANFAEDRKTRITFVISRFVADDYTIPCMCIYVDGVLTNLEAIGNHIETTFKNNGYKIYLGCDNSLDIAGNTKAQKTGYTEIYNFRVYNRALSMTEIVQNHVSDFEDPVEQSEQIVRNELLNQVNNTIPTMEFIMTAENFGNISKDNKQPGRIIFTDFSGSIESFDEENCTIAWQGTSTLTYAVKNYKIKFTKDENGDTFKYDLGNNIKEKVFTLKAD